MTTQITVEQLGAILGGHLNELRTKRKLSIRELGIQAQVSERAYIDWENGKKLPNGESLVTIANFYGVPVWSLLK